VRVREKKKTKYVKSELRLIETLDGICDRILQYNIHKVKAHQTPDTRHQTPDTRHQTPDTRHQTPDTPDT
jgi:hypothetical protein